MSRFLYKIFRDRSILSWILLNGDYEILLIDKVRDFSDRRIRIVIPLFEYVIKICVMDMIIIVSFFVDRTSDDCL